jgi:nitrate ABC transporter ATP-binding subunit
VTATATQHGAVSVRNVRKSFAGRSRKAPERLALDGFDLDVRPGEFLCLLGPSGCGKSTLLNLLAGFSEPDSGDVAVDGVPVKGPGPERGVLFQTPMLFPWLTTIDNVLYGPRARHERGDEVRRRAVGLLDTVGLGQSQDVYPHELSGGMRHRAAFARVLVNQPRVLLMDEPFGALDALTRAHLQDELLKIIAKTGGTVVMVTHDVDEAVLLSDRIVMMTNGPSATIGQVREVRLSRPRDRVALVHDERYIDAKTAVLEFLYHRHARPEAAELA